MEAALDQASVTLEVKDQSIDEVLGVVARRAGVQVTRTGNLYFLGQLRREDRGVLVRRVRRLSKDEVREAVATMASEYGQSVAFDDGLVVVGDRVEVLARLHEMLNQVEAAPSPVWVVQLYLLSLSAKELQDLGIDNTPALDLSLAFAAGSSAATAAGAAAVAPATANLKGGLHSLLRVAQSSEDGCLMAEPLFYLVDGSKSEIVRGDRVPVPRNVVSNQGTVTTQGYDFVQTGLTVRCELREVSGQSAALTVHTEVSAITDFVGSAPVVAREAYDTRCVVESGGVYLLGSMARSSLDHQKTNGLRLGTKTTDEKRILQVWGRAVRVGGPAVEVIQGG